ncbi:hypothetical protein BCR33DRAFT_766079 [Rhizoclosmatium globosum]|uniref:Uncharacterized protein n=1 Tax=Rhizoclosmatium globosum TaxID=329046 RepID=A0A1Y2CC62_9FUNG|nr:hypothetical protein BCR33DRAFT_766079 [Rhizoclosmatium globosum]|eukprot:ORY44477.1 hypothetical protein BCR33DRAFT_766079 [Rhizoclosmatium globosum]
MRSPHPYALQEYLRVTIQRGEQGQVSSHIGIQGSSAVIASSSGTRQAAWFGVRSGIGGPTSNVVREDLALDAALVRALPSGLSDVCLSALKLLVHAALGPLSRVALLLEAEGLVSALEAVAVANQTPQNPGRKRVSSEMLDPLHQQQQLPHHPLLRSMSEVSVMSSDSTHSAHSALVQNTAPSSIHPLTNINALQTSPLLFSPHELAELTGTSLESLNSPHLLAFHTSLLPYLQAFVKNVLIPHLPPTLPPQDGRMPVGKIDLTLITNFAAFRTCLDHVLRHAVRFVPPATQSSGASVALPWNALGSIVGNWNSVCSSGWKRRLGPVGFELCGPRGGGCAPLGLEEVLGRVAFPLYQPTPSPPPTSTCSTVPQAPSSNTPAIPTSSHPVLNSSSASSTNLHSNTAPSPSSTMIVDSESNTPRSTNQQDVKQHSPSSTSPTSSTSSSTSCIPTPSTSLELMEDALDTYIQTRHAWTKRTPPPPASGFIYILPLADSFDRKTRAYELEVEDHMRANRFTHQQRLDYIPFRTDMRVEFHPAATFLKPVDGVGGEGMIRLENEEEVTEAPPGYTVVPYAPYILLMHQHNYVMPRQRMTLLTGNVSNHHLFLSYGTIEERNLFDILDFPADLIEDAVTTYLEHFGPTTRVLPSVSLHSSSSPFNLDTDLKTRYRTAMERKEAKIGKGKQKARYDVATYERALLLLKGLGLFPRDGGGVIRCKSEYFWQEEAFSTVIQVLLMSSDQLTEYAKEPCILDYTCMVPVPNTPTDSPKLTTAVPPTTNGDAKQDVPPPRLNMIPTNKSRNRGPLPFRDGAQDAFLAVSCGILRRRLQMYPTTYNEDSALLVKMTDAYCKAKEEAHLEASERARAASIAAASVSLTTVPVPEDEEHEEKRRRKERVVAKDTDKQSDGAIPEEEEETMKVARSDDTLVSVSAVTAMSVDGASDTLSPPLQQRNTEGDQQTKPQQSQKQPTVPSQQPSLTHKYTATIPLPTPAPKPTSFSFTVPHPHTSGAQQQQQQPQQPSLEWFTFNRMNAIKFRMSEKKNLINALHFLEALVKEKHALLFNNNSSGGSHNQTQKREVSSEAVDVKQQGSVPEVVGQGREVLVGDDFDYDAYDFDSEFGSELYDELSDVESGYSGG